MPQLHICKNCSNAAYKDGVGFSEKREWFCSDRGMRPIERPDISCCTFGEQGEPHRIVDNYTVEIDTRAAVNGYFDWGW